MARLPEGMQGVNNFEKTMKLNKILNQPQSVKIFCCPEVPANTTMPDACTDALLDERDGRARSGETAVPPLTPDWLHNQ